MTVNRIDMKQWETLFSLDGLDTLICFLKGQLAEHDEIMVMDGDEFICMLVSPAYLTQHGLLEK